MSVDNSGIVLIGQEESEGHDLRLLFYSDKQIREASAPDSDASDYVHCNPGKNAPKLQLDAWEYGEPSGYRSTGIVGFYIESPSYGKASVDFAAFYADLLKIAQAWKQYAGELPKVFILNLQS